MELLFGPTEGSWADVCGGSGLLQPDQSEAGQCTNERWGWAACHGILRQ